MKYQHWLIAGLALAGALLSIFQQGYQFGISNHVYYVPPVLRLPELPQFAHEPFYATLTDYTTWVWPAFRALADEHTIRPIFFIAHLLSRLLVFAAILYWLSQLGVRASGLAIAAVVLAATPLYTGLSLVGRHGLFVNYFTHTDLTNPFIIAALLLAWHGRFKTAFAIAGIAFNINAFVAAWLGAALGLASLATRRDAYRAQPAAALRDAATMAVCFLIPAAPTLVWVARALSRAPAVDFDFIAYLYEYYPYHFLIDAAGAWELGQVACMAAIGALALVRGRFDRFWLYAYGGFLLVFAIGAVLPYLIASRVLIDLHLLRVDGIIHLFTVVVLCALVLRELPPRAHVKDLRATHWIALASLATGQWYVIACAFVPLLGPPRAVRWGLAATALAVTAVVAHDWTAAREMLPPLRDLYYLYLAVFVAVVLLARYAWRSDAMDRFALPVLMLVVLLPAALYNGYRNIDPLAKMTREERAWNDLVEWVRAHPRPGDYLIPDDAPENPDLQLLARVPVWVDWKRGAAVQWAPAYYHVWHERLRALREAKTSDALHRLACVHNIPNLVVHADRGPHGPLGALEYRNAFFESYRVRVPCGRIEPVK